MPCWHGAAAPLERRARPARPCPPVAACLPPCQVEESQLTSATATTTRTTTTGAAATTEGKATGAEGGGGADPSQEYGVHSGRSVADIYKAGADTEEAPDKVPAAAAA